MLPTMAYRFIRILKTWERDHTEKVNSWRISLLTTIGKLHEKVIKDQIVIKKTRGVELTCKMQGAGK